MLRHVAIIISKIRALLVPLHNVSHVDAVWEPLDVLLPRVVTVSQTSHKPFTTVKTAGLISAPCKETIDKRLCNVEGTSME